jgi:hypothetical protein
MLGVAAVIQQGFGRFVLCPNLHEVMIGTVSFSIVCTKAALSLVNV